MAIEKRPLGRTGVDVSVLGYGAMELRGEPRGPALSEHEAGRLLNAVLDSGIDLIDTSIDYGQSEERIGRHLAHRRDELFLASKCGCTIDLPSDAPTPYPHDYSPANVRAGVEQSLRKLRTDRLDLVQVHMSPSRSQLEADQVLETLQALREEGKLLFLGMSGILPNLPDHLAMGVFDVFQIPYSAVQREHEELIDEAARSGAGILVRGGVARGAPSTGKSWDRGPVMLSASEARRRWEEAGIDELREPMSAMEFVLRFTLSHPGLSSTIVGTSSPEHLAANVAAAEKGPLSPELYEKAKRRLSRATA